MILPDLEFVGNRHLQHSGAKWSTKHCLCYHIYLIPKDKLLQNAISFTQWIGLSIVENHEEEDAVEVKEKIVAA